ncbi:MAG: hypothetical protein M0Z66_08865 [Thermaerobacter sp.]|nr:hypothetical protein [Thermaerobacter sp.]
MGLRTPDEYRESLRDGRRVMFRGEWVADVTQHPVLRKAIDHAAIDYALAEDPAYRDLCTAEEDGEQISRFYKVPKTPEDLLLRMRAIEAATSEGRTVVTLIHEIGTDALFALLRVAHACDAARGTAYLPRVKALLQRARSQDWALAVAQTDTKGDRGKPPSEQEDPDQYLRIVERRSDGIVVRGAKVHTSVSINANALIVLPTRALRPGEEDYAVSFWLPLDTEGLHLIASPYLSSHRSEIEHPLSASHKMVETFTWFDDVFVPYDQVFQAGEVEYAGPLALGFVDFHRFTAVSYKLPLLDLLVGSASLIAELNGIGRAGHVRDKLAQLAMYASTVRKLLEASALTGRLEDPGIFVPDTLTVNTAKYHFAHGFHEALRDVQDIAGGLLVTAPAWDDMQHETVGPALRKYLLGAQGTAEERLRVLYMITDLAVSDLAGYHAVLAVHAEGSLEAEKLAASRHFDFRAAQKLARKMAGIAE